MEPNEQTLVDMALATKVATSTPLDGAYNPLSVAFRDPKETKVLASGSTREDY